MVFPYLHESLFFSQFISSRITHLSHTSEEDEDHTRAGVTLCFSNEACTLRLLAFFFFFAMLPFETAATRRSDILPAEPELRALILFVCHLALLQFFALV